MKKGDVIETLDDLPLHYVNRCCAPCHMETELYCPPVLLNKIKFTMIFGVEIAQMSMGLDKLLKLRHLSDEIGLQKKDAPATAVSATRRAMKARALG